MQPWEVEQRFSWIAVPFMPEKMTAFTVCFLDVTYIDRLYNHDIFFSRIIVFSRMRSEGSRFTWGSGGEAVFAKFCVCDRNRPQPLAVTP